MPNNDVSYWRYAIAQCGIPRLAGMVGLEPTTYGLTVRCSAIELHSTRLITWVIINPSDSNGHADLPSLHGTNFNYTFICSNSL